MHASLEHEEPARDAALRSSLTAAPRSVQRELQVKGDDEDVEKLTRLLGPPAGLLLGHKSGFSHSRVKIRGTEKASSDALGAALKEIVEDRGKHAQVRLSNASRYALGYFRDWQELGIDNLCAIESRVPGAGVATAIHEIWENYQSWVQGIGDKQGRYGPAHASAVGVESAVLGQLLSAPVERVAAAAGMVSDPFVIDYQTHYLSLQPRSGGGFDAKTVGRRTVARIEVDFEQGSDELSGDARLALETATNTHLREQTATACVTGWRASDEEATMSRRRADRARSYIVRDLLDSDEDQQRGVGADVGSRQAWSHDGGVRETPGVTVHVEAPA